MLDAFIGESSFKRRGNEESDLQKGIRAEAMIRKGMLSKANMVLNSPGLARVDDFTLDALSDPERRPRDFQQPLPHVNRPSRVVLDRDKFLCNIRSTKRGAAPGLSGLRGEHLRILLEAPDCSSFDGIYFVANLLANAEIPECIRRLLAIGGLTPLNKRDDEGSIVGVRGICAGDLLRRGVARTFAQMFIEEIVTETSPAQMALGSRAGIDVGVFAARAALELDEDLVLISLDGIGAYEHIWRGTMLGRLDQCAQARVIFHLSFCSMVIFHNILLIKKMALFPSLTREKEENKEIH